LSCFIAPPKHLNRYFPVAIKPLINQRACVATPEVLTELDYIITYERCWALSDHRHVEDEG
jgi:hypothetical protein